MLNQSMMKSYQLFQLFKKFLPFKMKKDLSPSVIQKKLAKCTQAVELQQMYASSACVSQ